MTSFPRTKLLFERCVLVSIASTYCTVQRLFVPLLAAKEVLD